MKRIGVLLSGCGVQDGSEIHEAALTLWNLDRLGVTRLCLAPDAPQTRVVNHASGQPSEEKRNMLVEAARIARGEIAPLAQVSPGDLNGLILPGGFGAAVNLCNYAVKGREYTVRDDVSGLLQGLHEQSKPIGAICIAPVVVAKVFGVLGISVEVTIGNDPKVGGDIEAAGAKHFIHLVDEAHVDREHRIATTPAYMLGTNLAEIAPGIQKVVEAVVDMA